VAFVVKYNLMAYSILPPPQRYISRLTSHRRSKRRKVKVAGALLTAGFIFFMVSIVGTAVAFGYFARGLPSPNELTNRQTSESTKIYDRHGTLLYNVFDEQNRTLVKLDKIPKHIQQATIAIEDQNFYEHEGFDLTGIARSAREIVVDKQLQGGSTLTQQLVKKALLSDERTVTRKIKELILAIQIERRYSKDEILQIYLNEIPYGGTAWGIEAAANQYFNKHVWELSLTESAVLAGLPQRPSGYSPFGPDPEAYINRTKDVLRRMREDGYIKKEEEEKAVKELPELKFAQFGEGIKAPHFSIYVKKILEEKYGQEKVLQGGMQVTTSLDLNIQNQVQDIVNRQITSEQNRKLKVSNGAAVVEDTKTGEILALVGSKDYFATDIPGNFDVATQGLRQPGSALKPFTYLTGFKEGYTPSTMWIDEKTDFGGSYAPGNYDDRLHGPMQSRYALANSYNIPAVKQLAVVGLPDMLKTLKDFGITTLNEPNKYGLSLTLGGGAIKLYELTNAYAILGNGGNYVEPSPILKITDSSGKVLFEKKAKEPRPVVEPAKVYLINSILSDKTAKYQAYGTFWANRLNFQENIGVKTGTAELKTDNWTFAYTPTYTVGIWVGNNDNTPMHPSLASGVTGAAPIYREVMENLLKGKPIDKFVRPAGVVEMEVDSVTGQKAGPNSGSKRREVFDKTNLPPEDDMTVKVRVCTPTGLLSNPSCEASGQSEERTYRVLYDPYLKQFRGGATRCDPCPPTTVDPNSYSGSQTNNKPAVTITQPSQGGVVSKGTVTMKASVSGTSFDIDQVTFTLKNLANNNESTKTDSSGGSNFTVTFTINTPGSYSIRAKAVDEAGNEGESSTITFTVI
jgi:1A family penicillin-binding protein